MSLQSLPPLVEPVWTTQPGETAAESAAFAVYCETRNLAMTAADARVRAMGWNQGDVSRTAQRWAWHDRACAYDRACIQAGWDERAARAKAVLVEQAERRARLIRCAGEWLELELAAWLAERRTYPSESKTTTKAVDVQRIASIWSELSQGLVEASKPFDAVAHEDHDFDAATATELEQLERLAGRLRRGA